MSDRRRGPRVLLIVFLVALWSASAVLQQPDGADRFDVRDVIIPMRDGVRLYVKLYVPKDQREPLPIEGYIFAFEDIRGRYTSEGTFVPSIFTAKASDFRVATHRVYRSAQHPSRVTVPVVPSRS